MILGGGRGRRACFSDLRSEEEEEEWGHPAEILRKNLLSERGLLG